MRLGIYGGTFNPIHYGHLINAEVIKNDYDLHRVIFIPVRMPVHKDFMGVIPAEDRLAMVNLAIKGNEAFEVSSLEIDRNGPSYTIDTLKEVKKIYPRADVYLIIGADSFNELHSWKDYEAILTMANLVVMRRPGIDEYRKDFRNIAREIILAKNPMIEISSTYIRERVRNEQGIRYLTPPLVCDYIKEKRLYFN
ncbi:MAG: nicotinate-nucleotide adenylyltransferase [bacterium]|nr:nicotinate-nucleotide adenylyltransferase [bacterium]